MGPRGAWKLPDAVLKRPNVSMAREGSMPERAKSWGCNGGAAPLAKIVWYYHTHLARTVIWRASAFVWQISLHVALMFSCRVLSEVCVPGWNEELQVERGVALVLKGKLVLWNSSLAA